MIKTCLIIKKYLTYFIVVGVIFVLLDFFLLIFQRYNFLVNFNDIHKTFTAKNDFFGF